MDTVRADLVKEITAAIEPLITKREVLQRAVELLDSFSDGYDWTGFYIMNGDKLHLGPYIGEKTPHTEISLYAGICGAAASSKKTVIVDDVTADPRHLACSLSTRSEIVVPLLDGEECLGEIDIDSNQPAFFSEEDREMLEYIAEAVVNQLKKLRST